MVSDRGSERLKIVVTDPIISRFEETLQHDGGAHHWEMAADWSEGRQRAAIAGADIVVCSSLPEALGAAGTGLRLVHVTGAGFDKIDLAALPATAAVANTFHHARPIAEHVMMVLLMLNRRVLPVDRELRGGTWRTVATDSSVPFHPTLESMVLGLVGLGSIGAEVARLGAALGLKVQAVRSNPSSTLPPGVNPSWVGGTPELPRLLSSSDVVVVTVPLSAETRGLIGPAELALMKGNAFLINVSRGAVIDQEALYAALNGGGIAGTGIDVWWGGPAGGAVPPAEYPFHELENVVLTPHYSGHAKITFERQIGRAHV